MTREEYIRILTQRLEGLDEDSRRDIILEIEDHLDGLVREQPEKSPAQIIDALEPPEILADSLREAAGLGPFGVGEASTPHGDREHRSRGPSAENSSGSSSAKIHIVIDDEELEETIRKAFDIARLFKHNRGGQNKEFCGERPRGSFEIRGTDLGGLHRASVRTRSSDVRVLFSNYDLSVDGVSDEEALGLRIQPDEGSGVLRIATQVGPKEPGRIDLRIPSSVDELEIWTLSGAVRVVDRVGALSVATASGDVDVETCEGDLEVKTASGDVGLAKCQGNLKVTTASGDIEVHVDDMCNAIEISTASGNVELVYPDGWDASFSLSTISGEIEHEGVWVGRGMVQIGSGLVPVKISTASGDIQLQKEK
jgi:hypothetical protein